MGFPAIGGKTESSPGRVRTAPAVKATSWQSGDTPSGKSLGFMSVTDSAEKIQRYVSESSNAHSRSSLELF